MKIESLAEARRYRAARKRIALAADYLADQCPGTVDVDRVRETCQLTRRAELASLQDALLDASRALELTVAHGIETDDASDTLRQLANSLRTFSRE